MPLPKRISYLVGADGTILVAYPDVKPSAHAAEVLADLERQLLDREQERIDGALDRAQEPKEDDGR